MFKKSPKIVSELFGKFINSSDVCLSNYKLRQNMIIEVVLLEKWQRLRSPEDTSKLAERLEGGYPELFSRAFREGKCSDEVFKVMAEFYEEKLNLIKEYL